MARHDLAGCSHASSVARPHRFYGLAGVAVVCGTLGGKLLCDQFRGTGPTDVGAAGWLLVAASLVQLRMAGRLVRCGPQRRPKWGKAFFLRLVWGGVACWIACQIDGRTPSREKLLALAAGWYSLCLVPPLFPAAVGSRRQRWAAGLHLPRVEQAAAALAIVLLAGEAALRCADWAADRRLAAREVLAGIKLEPGSQYHGRIVNRDGYCDDEFQSDRSAGQFRIAALGDETILAQDVPGGCLSAVERRLPEVEVYNFAAPGCHPGHYAAQMRLDVARFHPHLVLAFISVGSEIRPAPVNSPLTWQGLSMARRLWRPPLAAPLLAADARLDYESYLRLTGDRLLLCRTPLSVPAQRRWKELLQQLDRLAAQCRGKKVSLALVLVPADYQISPLLCQAAGRRIGCEAAGLDLELPQRRLISFAAEHDAAVIDLLPHFRAATQSPFCRQQQQLSEYGHRLAGRVIGDWLAAHYGTSMAAAAGNTRR